MNIRKSTYTMALGAAALALVGMGAHAAFSTQSVSSHSTGSLSVTLTSSEAQSGNGTDALVLATSSAEGSTYNVGPEDVVATNTGTLPATEITIGITDPTANDSTANQALDAGTWACIYSDGVTIINEPLSTVVGEGTFVVGATTIPVGGTDDYGVQFYAGPTESNSCGGAFNGISGGEFTTAGPFVAGVNSSALALNNPAQGGTITPTFTMTYSG
jgi:hypothetical protein